MKKMLRNLWIARIPILTVIVGVTGGMAMYGAANDLVSNGSFEIGTNPGNTLPVNAVDSTSLAGWTVQSGSIDIIGTRWTAGEGSRCLDLSGTGVGSIQQQISGLAPGSLYRLGFLLAGNPEAGPTIKEVAVSVGGVTRNFSFDITGRSPSNMGWSTQSLEFTASASTTTLVFTSLTGGLAGPALDAVTLTPVAPPEPTPPSIAAQPQSRTALVGEAVTFTVGVVGTPPFNYQWRFNGSEISGAIQASLVLSNVQLTHAGDYSVVVANSLGSATSAVAVLSVNLPPPQAAFDLSRDFSKTVNPNGPWSFGAQQTLGGVFNLLAFSASVPFDNGVRVDYWRVSNGTEPVVFHNGTSNTATSNGGSGVHVPGTVFYFPGPAGSGNNFGVIRFTAPATTDYRLETAVKPYLTGPPQGDTDFHIIRNGIQVLGTNLAAGASTAFSGIFALNTGDTIDLAIGRGADDSNFGSGLDITVVLRFLESNPPVIVAQPQSSTTLEGETASFSVSAMGVPPFAYQWSFNSTEISGATLSSLVLSNVQLTQAGNYSVSVANAAGSVTSVVAVLTVSTSAPPAATNLVLNGSFELGVSPGVSINLTATDSTSISNWTVQSGTIDYIGTRWNAIDGARSLDLSGISAGTISQGVTGFVQGRSYRLSFLMAGNPVGSPSLKSLRASVDSSTQEFSFDTTGHSANDMGWTEKSMTFVAPAPSATLVFTSLTEGSAGPAIDAVTILPVVLPPGPPVIVYQPQSLSVLEGASAAFRISAVGTPSSLSFQWLHNDKMLPDGTNSSLSLSNVALVDSGPYAVIVANDLGSVTSHVATLTVTQPPANVRVVGSDAAGGGTVSLPIQIRANGNENAIGFSLNFNTALLTISSVALGSGVPGGTSLLLNTNDAGSGRLGLGVALPIDATLSQGTQEVAVATFLVAPVLNQTNTTVGFGDQPTLRQISDRNANVLPAVYASGNIRIADAQLEGDLAPRPDGNRSVAIVDWVQMGRFVALLDTIGGTNEFQRADCAPRTTLGNGVLGASDWVQVGRYALGLDPLAIAGGPTEPAIAEDVAFRAASSGTKLSLLNSSIAQGQTNVVSVMIECQGTENAMTFSVTFDPAKLAFVDVFPGPAASSAALNQNASQTGAGRIGLAIALPPGTHLPAGIQEIVELRFAAVATAPASAAVAFGDLPLPKEVSDISANPIPTMYTPATISITRPPGPPLHITRSGNSLYITWPTSGSVGFDLEQTAGALGTVWSTVPGVIDLGAQKLAIVVISGSERYFRLKKP